MKAIALRKAKVPFLSKTGSFLKEVQAEMVKVAWPKKEQALRLTLIVVGVTSITALILGGLDLLFTKLIAFLVSH